MQTEGHEHAALVDAINITPLTDVFLVLLIIMMVVAPMVHLAKPEIKPPTDIRGGAPVETVRLVVEVTRGGSGGPASEFFVDGEPIDAAKLGDIFAAKLQAAQLAQKAFDTIVIRADAQTKSGAVMTVFDAAKKANFPSVTIAVESMPKGWDSAGKAPAA